MTHNVLVRIFFSVMMLWFGVSVVGALGVIMLFCNLPVATKPRHHLALAKGNA